MEIESNYQPSPFGTGPPYWTGETTAALGLLLDKGLLVPDTHLQAIIDAWLGIDRSDRFALAVVVPSLTTAINDALIEENKSCGCESEHLGPDGYGCKLNSSGVGANDE